MKRISVAIIGIPFALVVIWAGGLYFAISIMLISTFALWEYYKLSESKSITPNRLIGLLAGLILQVLIFMGGSTINQYLFILLLIFLLSTLIFELFSRKPNPITNIAVTITGTLYVSLMLSSLITIREFYRLFSFNENYNTYISVSNPEMTFAYFVFALFVTVWICDSAAYFLGKAYGKHKLFPSVSPKKSWEGAIAGFVASMITFTFLIYFLIPEFPMIHSIIIGILIGIFGQIGDLAESLLKRDAGIKDSSTILPGHGGFLDRFDSIIFVAPILFIYLYVLFCLI